MKADFTIKQGDTIPVFSDQLTYSDASVVDLTGATLKFVLRSLSADTPLQLTGAAVIANAATGAVQFTCSAADSGTAGLYMANWVVTFPGGAQMTFPTEGYLWVSVEENLTHSGGAMLVSLPDVKDYLSVLAGDRSHDAKLMRFIASVRPVVENITGPILPTLREEWHDGGQSFIRLRRRPASGYGTQPILDLVGVTEFRGPTPYPLKIVQDPAHGELYSCMLTTQGFVTRRSAGGGTIAFPASREAVHVTYRSGQASVPPNVYEGTLELIRLNYQQTQQSGRQRATAVADDEVPTGPALGFFVPGRVRELLAPTRRAPSVF